MFSRPLALVLVVAACSPDGAPDVVDDTGGKADRLGASTGDILATDLTVDLSTHLGRAVLDVRPDSTGHLTLDVHGLHIRDSDAWYRLQGGRMLLERLSNPARVTIWYDLAVQPKNEGLISSGVTLIWPYHCGNLFPCHTNPADGMTFNVTLLGVPNGEVAITPPRLDVNAPPYMLAWAVGPYEHQALGATDAGTRVGVYYLPRGKTQALAGTRHLTEAFDWLERTLGPYSFGDEVASVAVRWGPGALGGMEHHPFWHVADDAMGDEETHAHEAAHGWFGDGVRIRCWEDFVLSEGSASYLAARALGQVAGAELEHEIWVDYKSRLDSTGVGVAWPHGCNEIDIIEDGLFSDIPYMRGAFFLHAVADEVGLDTLDQVMAKFYMERRGHAAGMQDLLDTIKEETGFNPSALAEEWLRRRF